MRAGRVAQFYENWKNLTRDQQISQDILGAKIDCVKSPEQHNLRLTHFNHNESMIIDAEIKKQISKGVIEPAPHEEGEILSNIFIRSKTDGTHRMILNLKEFNKYVMYHHFKMDTIHTITKLMSKDCYMVLADLKDA